jgi:formate hydrogenlyase subunit 7
MSLWTWFGLTAGNASTQWIPDNRVERTERQREHGQEGVLGMPHYDPSRCRDQCDACAQACVTKAITIDPSAGTHVAPSVDWGKCIVCQMCTEVCPTGAFRQSTDWAVGVNQRVDLKWSPVHFYETKQSLDARRRPFRRSLHIRHVDAGSCNGCESELQALNNPFYNLHRLGIFFTASPRFADVLLVTGSVTKAMHPVLLETYAAMPDPKWVIATGTCAVSGGITAGNYACHEGLEGILPVDVYLPGCPPNPSAIVHALLMLVGRAPQRMKGGRIER